MPKEKNRIINYGLKKADQRWERKPLPPYWEERRAEEKRRQKQELELVEEGIIKSVKYFDPVLEQYRRQEWDRRLNGVWIFINGEPVYLTGEHYMYLQWSKGDHPQNDGYPVYYEPQLNRYYFRQLCWEDPWCHGYLMVGPRGGGKTAEEVSAVLNSMTKPRHDRNAAIQSKDTGEAQTVIFQQKMVPMFNAYPDFYKPQYNHGSNPKTKFVFLRRSKNSLDAAEVKYGPMYELNNTIEPYPCYTKALDSTTMSEILVDEIGKLDPTKDQNAYDRHSTNKRCIFRNQQKLGLMRCTTTIEEMGKGGDDCYKIWLQSDPRKRDGNGYTVSALYKYFISALDTQVQFADQFGNIPRAKALKHVLNEREPVKSNNYELTLLMRKNPITEDEAFIKDPGTSPYDMLILTNRIAEIKLMQNPPGKRVRPEWVNGQVDGDVELIPDNEGPVRIFYQPDEYWRKDRKIINACDFYINEENEKIWLPCNNDLWRASTDPIKYVETSDVRASKLGAHGMMMYLHDLDQGKPDSQIFSKSLLWRYHGRHTDPEIDYEYVIKMLRYFGHSILAEGNTSEFHKHLKGRGYQKFFIVRRHFSPDVLLNKHTKNALSPDQSPHSSTEVIESYIKRTATYIKKHGHRIPDLDTLEQLRDFNAKDRKKFDLAVSFSYSILAIEANLDDQETNPNTQKTDAVVQSMFPRYDISGNRSRLIEPIQEEEDDGKPHDFDDDGYWNQLLYGK